LNSHIRLGCVNACACDIITSFSSFTHLDVTNLAGLSTTALSAATAAAAANGRAMTGWAAVAAQKGGPEPHELDPIFEVGACECLCLCSSLMLLQPCKQLRQGGPKLDPFLVVRDCFCCCRPLLQTARGGNSGCEALVSCLHWGSSDACCSSCFQIILSARKSRGCVTLLLPCLTSRMDRSASIKPL